MRISDWSSDVCSSDLSVNDRYGHEVGDAVLCRIARRIARWEGPLCSVARLGGEEFGLLTVGMEGIVLDRFAESIRREIAACDHADLLGQRRVTASVGVAEVRQAFDVQRQEERRVGAEG